MVGNTSFASNHAKQYTHKYIHTQTHNTLEQLLNSENCTMSTFAGPGAGRFPTANSVMNDLIGLSQGTTSQPFPVSDPGLTLNPDYSSRFYVRIKCAEGLGIIRMVGEAAEQVRFDMCD